MMDIFTLLKEDHRTVTSGLEGYLKTGGKVTRELTMVFEQLTFHLDVEEKFLYPRLENEPETRDIIKESFEEHAEVRKLLKQVGVGNMPEDRLRDIVDTILEELQEHIQVEETDLFPKASRILSKQVLTEILESVQQMKAKSKVR